MAKAQLVEKGFEEIYGEEILKDSPTCSKEALRIVLTLTAQKKWKLNAKYQNCFFARRRHW